MFNGSLRFVVSFVCHKSQWSQQARTSCIVVTVADCANETMSGMILSEDDGGSNNRRWDADRVMREARDNARDMYGI